jgi:hypothetical protein
MTRKATRLTLAFATLIALPAWAASGSRTGNCTDVPLLLIVANQLGPGGISGDGLSLYNNPNNPNDPFNGGTQYQDGVGGAYVRFQICNGTNDFILNLSSTKSPVRYLNLDFSWQVAPADTANGALNLTGTIHQQGQQINEMANTNLYSNGQFVTCSGMSLNALSSTVTGGNAWFKPESIYAPAVPDCNGGTGPDLANSPVPTSPVQVVQQVDNCTWTVSPLLDSTGSFYRIGVAEVVKTGARTSTWVAGGQYQMPFSYKIQKLNCTP